MRFQGLYEDVEFTLHGNDGAPTLHKGGYAITDNGYQLWRIFTCPFNLHSHFAHVRGVAGWNPFEKTLNAVSVGFCLRSVESLAGIRSKRH